MICLVFISQAVASFCCFLFFLLLLSMFLSEFEIISFDVSVYT